MAELLGNPLRYNETLPSNNANDFVNNGWWNCEDKVSNMPVNWSYLFVYRMGSSNFILQFSINNESGGIFYRKRYAGTWLEWKEL